MRDVERRLGTRRVPVVVSVAVVLLLAGCGGGGTPEPPWGLDAIDQPSDETSIKQVFAAMPDEVAGRQRAASADPLRVDYGEGSSLRVRVLQFGEAAAAEGLPATAVGFLQRLVDSGGTVEVEARVLDPSSALVYVVCITTESFAGGGSRHESKTYAVAWGEPDSEWMFTAVADLPENRIALVEAFVDAARSIG